MVGVFKIKPSVCRTWKRYVNNGLFSVGRGIQRARAYAQVLKNPNDKDPRIDLTKPLCINQLRPGKYCGMPLVTGVTGGLVTLNCPRCGMLVKKRRVKNKYRFVWRNFYCPKVEYEIEPEGTSDAFHYRLAYAREGDIELDDELFLNQSYSGATNQVFRGVLRVIRRRCAVMIGSHDAYESMVEYALDQSHEKYKLRLESLRQMLYDGLWSPSKFLATIKAGAKEKWETAKFGKFMRLVVDLTCPGSLIGGYIAKKVKECMSVVDVGQEWQFVGVPNLVSLRNVFRELCTTQTFKFVFFSDDSSLGVRCTDGVFLANMDIKTADGSAGHPIFGALLYVTFDTVFKRWVKAAIDQCRLPLHLSSPYFNYPEILRPRRPVLYSGSVLTTLINNVGNLLIYSEIRVWLTSLGRLPTKEECGRMIPLCARRAGYLVALEVCNSPEELQFLKMSPGKDYLPFVNLGVLLRSLGSSDGDLPGKLSDELCDQRDSQIVAGMVHAGDHFLTRALRKKFGASKVVHHESYILSRLEGSCDREVGDEHVMRRYGLDESECKVIADAIQTMGVGSVVDSSGLRKIFSKDYGYSYDGLRPGA